MTPDPFTASQVYGDVAQWIRSLDNTQYPGAATLPIWLAEWFSHPSESIKTPDATYDNALKVYTMIQFIKAGGSVALSWNNTGDGWADQGLWTSPCPGGGQPQPWYYMYKDLKTFFGQGTKVYRTSLSDPVSAEVLVSAAKLLLLNKTDHPITLSVNATTFSLTPYQVSIKDFTLS